ncbi:hypothetical protein M2156_001378 [Streptomyces sp. SAI-149]|uniref:IS3 family transposase n=1 Tax=Streptomyces sp. NPDC008196 TaxID=3364819 RepID=UPI00247EECDD|nr:hypothetical protein [Streptomyces sp. SAI-119]MDH6495159.1 hypothetical protein [Streptomyces sp. SAI-149]
MLIKTECIRGRTFTARAEANIALFEYTDGFCDSRRIQERLGFLSPIEFEEKHCAEQATAEPTNLNTPPSTPADQLISTSRMTGGASLKGLSSQSALEDLPCAPLPEGTKRWETHWAGLSRGAAPGRGRRGAAIEILAQSTNSSTRTTSSSGTDRGGLRRSSTRARTISLAAGPCSGSAAASPGNRITVQIENQSLARNWGYHTDDTTKIAITPFDGHAPSSVGALALRLGGFRGA